ncbi:MAG: hypothetical protein J5520_06570 [Bacteroidales bacterium]|nr:hypothetical protein [Bacteroidales bacterium]MCR5243137.1 hypothetical protein [Bacteroidales bacterium]
MRDVLLVLSMLLMAACSRPSSEEFFMKSEDRDIRGRYGYHLDMADSTVKYGVDLIICMGCDDKKWEEFTTLPLTIDWISPDDDIHRETVWVSASDVKESSYFSKTIEAAYRRSLVPVKYGKWKMRVGIPETQIDNYNVTGVGIRLIRE